MKPAHGEAWISLERVKTERQLWESVRHALHDFCLSGSRRGPAWCDWIALLPSQVTISAAVEGRWLLVSFEHPYGLQEWGDG